MQPDVTVFIGWELGENSAHETEKKAFTGRPVK